MTRRARSYTVVSTKASASGNHVGRRERELLAVGGLEGSSECAAHRVGVAAVVRAIREVDHEIEALAQEPAVGEPLDVPRLELETRVAHDGACLVLEGAECGLERTEVAAVETDPDGGHA